MIPRALAVFAFACLIGACAAVLAFHPAEAATAGKAPDPAYTESGDMLPPSNYREWVYLTSGLDMNYKSSEKADHSTFDNVFVNPESYRAFLATGTWPDKTVMVLEARAAESGISINKRGHSQGALTALEVHVKDVSHFPGKWAFFSFDSASSNGTLIPTNATCYTCHAEHAAVDTTFVQFYPTLLPIAKKKGTLSEAFVHESNAASK